MVFFMIIVASDFRKAGSKTSLPKRRPLWLRVLSHPVRNYSDGDADPLPGRRCPATWWYQSNQEDEGGISASGKRAFAIIAQRG